MANLNIYNGVTIYGALDIYENFTFPIVDGTNGQVMVTDGVGNVTWQTPSGGTAAIFSSIDNYISGVTQTINHGAGTTDVLVQIINTNDNELIEGDIDNYQSNSLDVTLSQTLNNIKVVVVGGASGGGSGGTSTDVFVTGGTYVGSTLEYTNTTGGTFTITGVTGGGSGSTSPAGSDTWVQYNDAGSFGATSGLTWDGSEQFEAVSTLSGTTQKVVVGEGNLLGDYNGVEITHKNPTSGGTSGLWTGNLTNISGLDNHTVFGYADLMNSIVYIVDASPDGGVGLTSLDGNEIARIRVSAGDDAMVELTSTATTSFKIYDGNAGINRLEVEANGGGVTINEAYTFPQVDGTNTQVMSTDGFGNLYWDAASGGTSGSSIMIEGAGSGSTMRDGVGNLTFGTFSTALGGLNNLSNGYAASIAGGWNNNANASYSTVGGGFNNSATTYSSVVAGGDCNTAAGSSSTIGGGTNNSAAGGQSTIAGGGTNTTSGNYSTVAGGSFNTASSNYSTVAGGRFNTASSGYYSVIAGGINNTASGFYSTVGGGRLNTASNSYSTVGGGMDNDANGFSSSVLGGSGNNASGNMSSIIGGCGNTVSGNYSAIIAGQSFTLSASSTVMVPNLIINDQLSFNNIITSSAATIGSGGGLPAINEGFMQVSISGSTYKIPYFNV